MNSSKQEAALKYGKNLVLRRRLEMQRQGKGAPYGVLGRGGEIVSTAEIVEKAQVKRRHILCI